MENKNKKGFFESNLFKAITKSHTLKSSFGLIEDLNYDEFETDLFSNEKIKNN